MRTGRHCGFDALNLSGPPSGRFSRVARFEVAAERSVRTLSVGRQWPRRSEGMLMLRPGNVERPL
jgi:hypothetical protein